MPERGVERPMAHLFEPALVNDAFGDPGLYCDFRDERRAILFDLGDITALPPRKLMRLTHAFVTHTHMDHFAGFDHFLRIVLGRKERIVLTGGPAFVDQVEHKLRAYTWNVVHRYEMPLEIVAREVRPDGTACAARFASPTRFAREPVPGFATEGDVLHDEATFRVRGRFVDHEMPCLAYAVEEKAHVSVAPDRMRAMGIGPGAWLRELKQAVLGGAPREQPIEVRWRDREGEHAQVHPVASLERLILDVAPGRRVGYVTDLRYVPANVAQLEALLSGVDLLFIESVFLEADAAHGARKNHLTARQAGEIGRRLGARHLVPFHFSPRYEGRGEAVRGEALAAFAGHEAIP